MTLPSQSEGHSPGPWKCDTTRSNIDTDIPHAGVVEDAEGWAICTVWADGKWRENPDEAAANARLIARAPDLLAENSKLKGQGIVSTFSRRYGRMPCRTDYREN